MAKTTTYTPAALKLAPDGLPLFDCAPSKKDRRYMSFVCPTCKQRNHHTKEPDRPGAADGHRASHCACWRPWGYHVVEVKGGR